MRTQDEIQKAHDMLIPIILGEVPNPFGERGEDGEILGNLRSACDVLCWVLKHDHNQAFAENLEKIRRALGPMMRLQ